MKILTLLLILFILAGGTLYMLANESNFYLHGYGGPNYIQVQACDDRTIGIQPGYIVGTGFGYKFDLFRAEVDLSYRYNSYKEGVPLHPNIFFDHGAVQKISCMANIIGNSPFGLFIPYLKPYVGFGLGIKKDIEEFYILSLENYREIWLYEGVNKDVGLACQGIIGVGMPFTPNTCTKLEYRIFKDQKNVFNHAFLFDISRSF